LAGGACGKAVGIPVGAGIFTEILEVASYIMVPLAMLRVFAILKD
jgi:hypothetical protein